jgi:Tol biopolymer transport system component
MPEDTFEDLRERLFEAAWSEPVYPSEPERVLKRARRRAATTIAGAALAAVAAIVVAASTIPLIGQDRTARFPTPVDDREFVVDLDTGAVRELHSIQKDAWVFDLSPSGDRIAFTSDVGRRRQIWIAEPDGSNAEPVTDDPVEASDPDWSPDGHSIVYVGWGRTQAGRDLFVLDLETGRSRRLLRTVPDEWNPDWSPDGTRILYHVSISGSTPEDTPDGIAALPPPTSYQIQIVDVRTGRRSVVAGGRENLAHDGSWLPDDRVVYMKGFEVGYHDPVRWALVSSTADGSDRKEIVEVPSDHYAWEAVVSPDGTRIAFASDLDHTQWVLVHDLRTGETTRVIPGWYPMWLDDGRLLVQRDPSV